MPPYTTQTHIQSINSVYITHSHLWNRRELEVGKSKDGMSKKDNDTHHTQ